MLKKIISEEQSIVLSIVREYLDENKPFEVNKLIPYLKNQFSRSSININEHGIKQILQNLVENYYIVEGSKLYRKNILKNENRRDILNIIKKNPGIYFNRILKQTRLANHVVAWHLNILLKFNCIEKCTIESHEIYYPFSMDPKKARIYYYLSKKKTKEIIAYILTNRSENTTKSMLSREINTHYNTISKYVDDLSSVGILLSKEMPRKTIYYLNHEIDDLINHLIPLEI